MHVASCEALWDSSAALCQTLWRRTSPQRGGGSVSGAHDKGKRKKGGIKTFTELNSVVGTIRVLLGLNSLIAVIRPKDWQMRADGQHQRLPATHKQVRCLWG